MPRRTCPRSLAACLLVLAGCSPPGPPGADAGTPDAAVDAGPCAEAASLYGLDLHEQEETLTGTTTLPITLGFQGFQYVRIGLRTARTLPPTVNLFVQSTIPGTLDQTTTFGGAETRTTDGGSETADVSVMYNDVPLAQLLGQTLSLRVWTTSPGCVVEATSQALLVQGAFQGPDGGLTLPDGGTTSPDGGDGG